MWMPAIRCGLIDHRARVPHRLQFARKPLRSKIGFHSDKRSVRSLEELR